MTSPTSSGTSSPSAGTFIGIGLGTLFGTIGIVFLLLVGKSLMPEDMSASWMGAALALVLFVIGQAFVILSARLRPLGWQLVFGGLLVGGLTAYLNYAEIKKTLGLKDAVSATTADNLKDALSATTADNKTRAGDVLDGVWQSFLDMSASHPLMLLLVLLMTVTYIASPKARNFIGNTVMGILAVVLLWTFFAYAGVVRDIRVDPADQQPTKTKGLQSAPINQQNQPAPIVVTPWKDQTETLTLIKGRSYPIKKVRGRCPIIPMEFDRFVDQTDDRETTMVYKLWPDAPEKLTITLNRHVPIGASWGGFVCPSK